MSSGDEDSHQSSSEQNQNSKRRKLLRACDTCRRKKIRCDGPQMPGKRCSLASVITSTKRGPPKGYVQSLEIRVERLEKLLRRICPDETLYKELIESPEDKWTTENPPADPSFIATRLPDTEHPGPTSLVDNIAATIRRMNNYSPSPKDLTDDEEDICLLLADNFKQMHLDRDDYRFFGKSSGLMLIHNAIESKNEYSGKDMVDDPKQVLRHQRKEFWTTRPWEHSLNFKPTPKYQFPEPDLAHHLIDCYFDNVNLYLPLLHRPTFEKLVAEGLHLTDASFVSVYLLVCAVGARYSSDDRVRLPGIDSFHSSGWKWFNQVQMAPKSLLGPPNLYDIQTYSLSVQFLQGSSSPQSCWIMVGIGIRLAQDVGAHRRKVPNHIMTVEDELWKRAFWVLVCMDRMVSSTLGRPCAIQDEDFDLDLPADCDDEYWEHEDPEKRFKQSPHKPSIITAFILCLKLQQILAFSLRTIYSINKSKILLGFVGQKWEQHIVAELDSALNKWVDSVPDHLRWDPNREDDDFFNQSVALYAGYYHVQILVHRPFIPSPSKPSPLSFPSLAICTNAARSCSHIVHIQNKRNPITLPQIQMSVFTSGIVLLLSIWGGKRSGLSPDPRREMSHVHKCMDVLKQSEDRWPCAGRFWDVLYELASVGELPLPQVASNGTNKRERDSETLISAAPDETPSLNMARPEGYRNIAGSRRVNKGPSLSSQARQPSQSSAVYPPLHQQDIRDASPLIHILIPSQSHNQTSFQDASLISSVPQPSSVECFALPVYSDELGRIPLHGQVSFSDGEQNYHPQSQQQQHQSYWFTDINNNDYKQPPSSNHIIDNPSKMVSQASYASMGDISSMASGHDMYPATGRTMSDPMAGTSASGDRSTFGAGLVDDSRMMAHPTADDVYRTTSMDTGGDPRHLQSLWSVNQNQEHQQQPNGTVGVGQHPDLAYSFADSDTIAMWSNAPSGFELDDWGTYLNNVNELTWGHGHSSGLHDSKVLPNPAEPSQGTQLPQKTEFLPGQ